MIDLSGTNKDGRSVKPSYCRWPTSTADIGASVVYKEDLSCWPACSLTLDLLEASLMFTACTFRTPRVRAGFSFLMLAPFWVLCEELSWDKNFCPSRAWCVIPSANRSFGLPVRQVPEYSVSEFDWPRDRRTVQFLFLLHIHILESSTSTAISLNNFNFQVHSCPKREKFSAQQYLRLLYELVSRVQFEKCN